MIHASKLLKRLQKAIAAFPVSSMLSFSAGTMSLEDDSRGFQQPSQGRDAEGFATPVLPASAQKLFDEQKEQMDKLLQQMERQREENKEKEERQREEMEQQRKENKEKEERQREKEERQREEMKRQMERQSEENKEKEERQREEMERQMD